MLYAFAPTPSAESVQVIPSEDVIVVELPTAQKICNAGDQSTDFQVDADTALELVHVIPSGEYITTVFDTATNRPPDTVGDHAMLLHVISVEGVRVVHVIPSVDV